MESVPVPNLITQYFSVGPPLPMSCDESAYEAPEPHPSKKRRNPTSTQEMEPSTADKAAFWAAVATDDLHAVRSFCVSRPELMTYWKLHEGDLQDGPLVKHAGLRKGGQAFRAGSLAVLFASGFDVPDDRMPLFLSHLFGSLASNAVVLSCMDRITRRLDTYIKAAPGNLERVLVAAARQRNYEAFHTYLPKAARKCAFDLTPVRTAGDVTILQALAGWDDPRARSVLFTEVLARSSTAYILSPCKPEYVEFLFGEQGGLSADDPPPSTQLLPRNVLEELATVPEPNLLAAVLARLRSDGFLPEGRAVLLDALLFSLRVQGAKCDSSASDIHLAFSAFQMQLVSLLDETHLAKLRTRLHELQANAIRVRAAYCCDVDSPVYAAATASVQLLARVMATCTSVVRYAAEGNAASLLVVEKVSEAEEALFADRYKSYAQLVDTAVDMRRELDRSREHARGLEDMIRQHQTHMRTIQTQALTISRLRQQAGSGTPVSQELDTAEQEFLQALEDRMLLLRLPDVPEGGLRKTGSYADLDARLLSLSLPVPPGASPVSLPLLAP